jgi:TPR repeat protein
MHSSQKVLSPLSHLRTRATLLSQSGQGVARDKRKEVYHLEEAAIRGHVISRFNLGCEEGGKGEKGMMERAVKHYIIAANHGYDDAIEVLRDYYAQGLVRKEEFATALRAYQAAVDATKSPQREDVEKVERVLRATQHHN